MLLEQRIQNLKTISASEKIIAKYLLEQKYKIKTMSTRDIGKETYTSSATIVHFAKKLGYSGFNELKEDYLSELQYIETHFQNINANLPFTNHDSLSEITGKMSTLIKETIDDTYTLIHQSVLEKAIDMIAQSQSIYVFGIGSSSLFAELFKYKMMRIGKKVEVETKVGEYGFNINLIPKNDGAILISYSGETSTVLNYAHLLKEKRIPIIVLTSIGDNTLKSYANIILHISTREKQYSKIGSFSSEYSTLYLLDMLYSGYFSLEHKKNLENKIQLSQKIEKCRNPQSEIIKE